MSGAHVQSDFWVNEYITPWDVYQHGITRILASKRTAWQDMAIVESGAFGKALVLDGKWQSCTTDEFLYHEPLVHPAMVAHARPRRVLVLGGGEGATLREVLRWRSVEKVVMIDIDGEVVEACKEHLAEMHQGAFDDPRTELVIGDALHFLDETDEVFDVIVSDLSDPIEEGPSFALFTREYFEKARRILAPGGRLVVQAGPTSPAEHEIHVRLVRTLLSVFANARSYSSHTPSYGRPWGFVLASDAAIDSRPEPEAIDRRLATETTGGFRTFDGESLLGLLQTPGYIRRAIAAETRIYTAAAPPRFFGTGAATQRKETAS